jgi:hypothetical protein
MKPFTKMFWVRLATALLAVLPAFAQPLEEARERASYSQPELDQMLAPIALYPDVLLSQVLIAATYPLEIVQAARWVRANPDLQGDAAVRAVTQFEWDPSVKSLVAFPRLLQQLDERLDWTERLGNAFLGQEYELMRVVQQLRWRAYAAGNLRSGNELAVRLEGTDLSVETAAADRVYVPSYDARAVYGAWEWPQYEPAYWAPGPVPFVAIAVSPGFFFATCDWAARQVRFGQYRPYYFRNVHRWQRNALWRHDPDHRRGVTYRNVDARHLAPRPLERPVYPRRVESNELQRVPQASAGVPRAEVRTGNSLSRPVGVMPAAVAPRYAIERAAEEPRSHALERRVAPAPSPVQVAPQAFEPSPLARPEPAPLARHEAPSPPPQAQAASGADPNALRRRER